MPRKRKANEITFEPIKSGKGEFTAKGFGKVPSAPRPEFVESKFQLPGIRKNMPLDEFFRMLALPANAQHFIDERDVGKATGRKQRSTIFSILALEELVYGVATRDCNTDLQCIQELLNSDFVTDANYIAVYKALHELMNPVLYGPGDYKAEQTKRSDFINILESPAKKSNVSKFFHLSPVANDALRKEREQLRDSRLTENVKIPDIVMLEIVHKLVKSVEKPLRDIQWFSAAVQLVQASVGSRWIEVCRVSQFELSTEPKYDPSIYIVVKGVAKEGTKASAKFRKEYEEALNEGDEVKLAELNALTDEKLTGSLPDVVIVKPVLFAEYGITPERVIKLVRDIRSYIAKTVSANLSLQKLSAELLRYPIELFEELWAPTGFLKLLYNKTHTWRKIYASYSLLLFNNGGNINI